MPYSKDRREKYKILSIEVANNMFQEIEKLARKADVSRSELVRRAVWDYIRGCGLDGEE